MFELNKGKYLEKIKSFSEIIGVSGHEDVIAQLLYNDFEKNKLFIKRDSLGGIYAGLSDFTGAKKKLRVLVCAHMDEVGFMVKEVLANGIAKVIPIGGITTESLIAQRVFYMNNKVKVKGMFLAVPTHLKKNNSLSMLESQVDFGFSDQQEAANHGLKAGTVLTFDASFESLTNEHRYMGKAIDNRYGCSMVACLADDMKKLSASNPEVEVIIGATVMEEIGLKGAQAAIDLIKPDFVIVLDCSPAADTLQIDTRNGVLGNGVLLRISDKAMILPERLKRYQTTILSANNIRYQSYVSSGGTDAGKIIELNQGTPTTTCCIPARYIHHGSAIFDMRDVIEAYKAISVMCVNYKLDIHNYLHYNFEV